MHASALFRLSMNQSCERLHTSVIIDHPTDDEYPAMVILWLNRQVPLNGQYVLSSLND